tara:strand:- start:1113 stop:1466 length:354 start_codon:yes stop_codon:yes gene_type:complete
MEEKTFRKMTIEEIDNSMGGSRLRGLEKSYQELVELLGEPYINNGKDEYPDDGYKTDVHWAICDKNDVRKYIQIWNYKDGPAYCGSKGTPIEKMDSFSLYYSNEQILLQIFPEVVLL